jgi:hypothetical protein
MRIVLLLSLIPCSFDNEGFSVWRFDFKYNDELTHTFMSANQITGFFNRMEGSRKYVFGSAGVLGETNNSVITGAIVMRGQDHKIVMDVAPDWESYSYQKLDLANEADKAYFEAALAWDLEIDGKKWVDGKLVSHPLIRDVITQPHTRTIAQVRGFIRGYKEDVKLEVIFRSVYCHGGL